MKRFFRALVCLSAALMLCACNPEADPSASQDPTKQDPNPVETTLRCVEISRFSGQFVEDGSDRQVSDVAAILVANNTGKFVDLATITYQVGDRTATFKVTGLPAGQQAWVLEQNAMQLKPSDEMVFDDCVISYHPDPVLTSRDLAVSRSGHALTLTNQTGETLVNVCVYYKNQLDDGSLFGGITYQMIFDTLEPGQSLTLARDHFMDNSVIVRFSYQLK
jgi:hypothetical protein